MKKRILALALVASMCVSLAACGNSGSKETEGTAAKQFFSCSRDNSIRRDRSRRRSSQRWYTDNSLPLHQVNWIQSTTVVLMKARLSKMSVIL